jgi:S1-C subfamily serine protease
MEAMSHLFVTAVASLLAQGSDENHRKVYDAVVESVVAIRCFVGTEERSGSGVVLSKDGLLLVSAAVCPKRATNVRVWMKGPKFYRAEVVGSSDKDEITLIRIKPKGDLKPIELGASAKVKIGDVAYTLGNASNSFINNDSPSFNVGVVSGTYKLAEAKLGSAYVGTVFETTAAVNVGMSGAPLLDASGKMIGFVTLNYSPHRFLGSAIPIDTLKFALERLRDAKEGTSSTEDPPAEQGEGWFGANVVDANGKVVIDAIDAGGPADSAGLRKGIVILGAGEQAFKTAEEFRAFLKPLLAGTLLTLTIDEDGLKGEVKVTLEKKK